jgi:hypothetical protein
VFFFWTGSAISAKLTSSSSPGSDVISRCYIDLANPAVNCFQTAVSSITFIRASFIMLSSFVTLSSTLVALATLLPYARADCAAYGIDFQNGQSYFINSADTSNFTTVTQFTGCTGVANVILVAPNEDSWLCSDISTTPDGTNQLSTWYATYSLGL